jgi:putative endonuclease
MKTYYVYILANRARGMTYIGVTNNLLRRMIEHREGVLEGYTKQFNVHHLVYYQATESIEAAIAEEKRLKNWRKDWKKNLIERENPNWEDLFPALEKAGQ